MLKNFGGGVFLVKAYVGGELVQVLSGSVSQPGGAMQNWCSNQAAAACVVLL